LIDHRVGKKEFFLEVFQRVIIEVELPFEYTIGDTPALTQQREDLVQDIIKAHSDALY
jgi:hypothetical protein